LMSPASLGIVTFRRHPAGIDDEVRLERLNAAFADAIERQGGVVLWTGRVRRCFVRRICVLTHSTSQAELHRGPRLPATPPVNGAGRASRELPGDRAGVARPLRPRPGRAALARRLRDARRCAAEGVLLAAREHDAVAGEAIVEQWEVSRDLYVILAGEVEITA